jgi:site-specific DNA-methyltransferase (adenine-specific)
MGHYRTVHCFGFNTQFSIPTKQTYEELINVFNIDKMDGFISYDNFVNDNKDYNKSKQKYMKSQHPSIFNLWEGKKYKSNVLEYKKDYGGLHPTQKPILLLEDLIKTYSNENDLVVDLTMGSGSCGVACKNTNRSFVGIELDDKYFNIAKDRINACDEK